MWKGSHVARSLGDNNDHHGYLSLTGMILQVWCPYKWPKINRFSWGYFTFISGVTWAPTYNGFLLGPTLVFFVLKQPVLLHTHAVLVQIGSCSSRIYLPCWLFDRIFFVEKPFPRETKHPKPTPPKKLALPTQVRKGKLFKLSWMGVYWVKWHLIKMLRRGCQKISIA